MEAKLSNLFNVRPEEIDLEPDVLHEGSMLYAGDYVSVPKGVHSYEFIRFVTRFTASSKYYITPPVDVEPDLLLDTSHDDICVGTRAGTDVYATICIKASDSTETSLRVISGASSWSDAGLLKVVGYKRRTSSTGLAELLQIAARKNLFINTWHAGAKVVNQRSFNGDWSVLSVGDFGYDMWLKTSSTHKGFIVEAGLYKPSTKYQVIADDGAIKGEVFSPADGGNWMHSFPFASDKFSLREGTVEISWSPESQADLNECYSRYIYYKAIVLKRVEAGVHYGGGMPLVVTLPTGMKATDVSYAHIGGTPNTVYIHTSETQNAVLISPSDRSWAVGDYKQIALAVFGGLLLTDVTDDAEHRVVWG